MNHRFPRRLGTLLVLFATLVLAVLLFSACDPEECRHFRTTDTLHEPDCSRQGYVLHVCRDCGYTYKSDFTEPYGHTITTSTVAPTCTAQGYTTFSCHCGYTYTADYIEPLGHDLGAVVTLPTCTESGYTTYTCQRECGFTFISDATAPNGHELASVYYAATCTTGSYTRYMCANCDMDYRSAVSEPLGHTFTDTVVRPSIARTGHTKHTCHCGYSYTDSYVWYSDIFTGAYVDGGKVLATGVDISFWNENIDWNALAATGLDYVIIRGGSVYQTPDRMFEEHYKNARAVGLDVGCYFYTYATSVEEVLKETEAFLKILDGKTFEYPIYFDIEDNSLKNIPQETLMEMCLAFCQTMSDHGYFPAIYTYHNWLINILHTEELTTLYDLWYARYPLDDQGTTHFEYGKWSSATNYNMYGMWQYTKYGRIAGISGDVDLNFCYKDYPSIMKKYGYNGFTAE